MKEKKYIYIFLIKTIKINNEKKKKSYNKCFIYLIYSKIEKKKSKKNKQKKKKYKNAGLNKIKTTIIIIDDIVYIYFDTSAN